MVIEMLIEMVTEIEMATEMVGNGMQTHEWLAVTVVCHAHYCGFVGFLCLSSSVTRTIRLSFKATFVVRYSWLTTKLCGAPLLSVHERSK